MRRKSTRRHHDLDRRALLVRGILAVLGVVAVFAILYGVGRRLEAGQYGESARGNLSERFEKQATITYGDSEYVYNKNLMTVLMMGIDQESSPDTVQDWYRNTGQADFLLLMILNTKDKTVTQLQIDRDTMTDITTLGVLGNVSGTRIAQICLSHSFGDGQTQSCELSVEAVQRLLYGIPIDFYVSINLDAIDVLNDAIGGVTVTLEDDFAILDPTMQIGTTLTLHGEQAEYFVRHRMGIGDGSNAQRMLRQRMYMSGFVDLLSERIRSNPNEIGTLYDLLGDALQTNMKRGRMINEVNKAVQYELEPVVYLAGEHVLGAGGYIEFHADEAALQKQVIDLFYVAADGK